MIHDKAKITKNASKNTGVVDGSLTCLDRSLQLVINIDIDEVPGKKKTVASFKRLALKLAGKWL